MASVNSEIRWAPKVRQDLIRRLYESEARGIMDEELIDEAGIALYLRCKSILEVTEAVRGRVKCFGCGEIFERESQSDHLMKCGHCGWEASWRTYQKSYQDRQLFGGAALSFFEDYVKRYLTLSTPKEKLLLIDRLIHEFHWYHKADQENPHAVRPTAANLIQGKGIREVVDFLDDLTYGERSSPETVSRRDDWRKHAGVNAADGDSENP